MKAIYKRKGPASGCVCLLLRPKRMWLILPLDTKKTMGALSAKAGGHVTKSVTVFSRSRHDGFPLVLQSWSINQIKAIFCQYMLSQTQSNYSRRPLVLPAGCLKLDSISLVELI